MNVTALPPNGTVLLADGVTPVRLNQVLTMAECRALKFKPALNSAAGSSRFGRTTKPDCAVVDTETWLPAGLSTMSAPQDSGARTVGIKVCREALASCAIITELPSNGTILLADGTSPVAVGQTLTAAQLTRLRFRPARGAEGHISNLSYLVVGAAGSAIAGCVLFVVHPAAPPSRSTSYSTPTPATMVESSSEASANPAALQDARLPSIPSSGTDRSVAGIFTALRARTK